MSAALKASEDYRNAPMREAKLLAVDLDVDRRADGTIYIASKVPLKAYEADIPAAFSKRAALMGDKPALARRGGDGEWVYTTYAQLKRDVDAAATWLAAHVPAGRTVMVLTGNTPGFATFSFAAWSAGLPVCPVSTTYGALGGDYGRLKHVIAKVRPALILAENGAAMAKALEALDLGDAIIVTATPDAITKPATAWSEVLATEPNPPIVARKADDVAAYMLTSGSTGLPKIVPITFDNLAANSAQCQQMIGEAAGWHDVMLDWLPWHHAAGAFVLRTTLLEGGTLYIDDGKPAPGLFNESIRNLREIGVAYFNNVPLGYTLLVEALETDPVLRKTFFSRLRLMLYGGAGLSQPVYDRLQALAVAETGHRIMMTSGYGATETVSAFMAIHFETDKVGIGLPAPGASLKLVPTGDRYDVRAKGPNVTTGYLDEPGKTAEAFDDEGYYRTGDLAVFHEPGDPTQGLAFAGRAAEEFKLSSGTWVYGGKARDDLLKALSPLATEVVLADDNRPFLTVMLWPAPGATREAIAQKLAAFNAGQHGGSRIHRALLLSEPPQPNAHEMSDKGTVNRRAVIDRRKSEVERLYADAPDADVIVLS
ncbi:AMP-binding protein [Caulobacter sp. NIBR2454]|uniref:AMP-binding protein n=1 Tax=Caulobacter sp. NIBR2454 TaxID=3015996 RepID=UPI0022B71E72|nr:AMP-binding protein [Caulobacter sp. NIBR2454]